eukprot:471694-Hanusia_phi.AAC.1
MPLETHRSLPPDLEAMMLARNKRIQHRTSSRLDDDGEGEDDHNDDHEHDHDDVNDVDNHSVQDKGMSEHGGSDSNHRADNLKSTKLLPALLPPELLPADGRRGDAGGMLDYSGFSSTSDMRNRLKTDRGAGGEGERNRGIGGREVDGESCYSSTTPGCGHQILTPLKILTPHHWKVATRPGRVAMA